jgi:hypothetical protein
VEILRDLQDLARAVEDSSASPTAEASASGSGRAAILERMGRPERVVTPPQLDSAAVDDLIKKTLADVKLATVPLVDDDDFIRRVMLDVTGKLPTPEEMVQFARDKNPRKRSKLIDRLLESEDFARNWARYWRDVIRYRATVEQPRIVNYPGLEDWLKEQWHANTPWDEIARGLITATGNNMENGAATFVSAHQGNAVELAGEVSRIFMGIQIQCAQCHDHPTDSWKRDQFHEFAAFFAGLQVRPNRRGAEPMPGATVVARPGRVRYTMPDLKEPTRTIPVEPKFFLASQKKELPRNLGAEERRVLAASYVTGQDNPWFAKSFVNRTWYALMGEAFYVPVDDMGPEREARASEALETISQAFATGGYDIRWLFRLLLNTRTYQRQFRPVSTPAGKTPFASNCPSRLRSDQIVDALIQALNVPLDGALRRNASANAGLPALARQAGRDPRGLLNQLYGVDPSTPNEEILGTIPQALFLMNSDLVNRSINRRGGVVDQILTSTPDNRAAVEAAYLRILSRRPSPEELRTISQYLAGVPNRREAFEDLVWCLVNSTEFISRR